LKLICKKKPKASSKIEWYKFCFGNIRNNSTTDPDTDNQSKYKYREPLLTLLYNMEQVLLYNPTNLSQLNSNFWLIKATIVQLFEYIVEWIDDYGYSNEAVFIYYL
jgi:hypothetical protein